MLLSLNLRALKNLHLSKINSIESKLCQYIWSAAMLITPTIEICIQQLGRVEEMVFTARRSYASAVLGVVILSVCHTRAL